MQSLQKKISIAKTDSQKQVLSCLLETASDLIKLKFRNIETPGLKDLVLQERKRIATVFKWVTPTQANAITCIWEAIPVGSSENQSSEEEEEEEDFLISKARKRRISSTPLSKKKKKTTSQRSRSPAPKDSTPPITRFFSHKINCFFYSFLIFDICLSFS